MCRYDIFADMQILVIADIADIFISSGGQIQFSELLREKICALQALWNYI